VVSPGSQIAGHRPDPALTPYLDRLGSTRSVVVSLARTLIRATGFLCSITPEERTTMRNAIVRTLTIGAAAIVVATATGCSNKELLARIDAAEAAAKSAAQDAAAAKSAADAAASSASSASNAASAAQSTANQALQAANGAQACCDATNEKIDRAFKRSMGK